jgi:hypothetical protein
MAYTKTQEFEWTPNSGVPLEIATSFEENLLDGAAGEAGYGTFLNRSIASDLLYYYATKFPFDQMSQLFGSLEATPHGKHEWFEADALLEYQAEGVTKNAANVINNTEGGTAYVPATEALFVIDEDDDTVFALYDIVRYETGAGDYAYGWVVDKNIVSTNTELTLQSIDGENLPVAAADDVRIERIASNLPQDLDYDPQPRQSNPTGYITFTQNYRREIRMTRKFEDINRNGGTLIDLVEHHQKQLSENFRRDRETDTLLGSGAKTIKTLSNGDKVQFSNGIYYQVREDNLHTSDFKTSGVFDADKFKRALNNFMLFNFGGESGGPAVRDFYVDATMQSYFDQAWEDRQRFMSTEYVAGVKVDTFENNQGRMDIMKVPNWSEIHPIPNAQIRGGSAPKGVGLLLPMDADHVTRVQQTGFGPRQEVFRKDGGDRVLFQRMESIEGLAIKLKQHTAVMEEIAE